VHSSHPDISVGVCEGGANGFPIRNMSEQALGFGISATSPSSSSTS
jgi:hypothetical protein